MQQLSTSRKSIELQAKMEKEFISTLMSTYYHDKEQIIALRMLSKTFNYVSIPCFVETLLFPFTIGSELNYESEVSPRK